MNYTDYIIDHRLEDALRSPLAMHLNRAFGAPVFFVDAAHGIIQSPDAGNRALDYPPEADALSLLHIFNNHEEHIPHYFPQKTEEMRAYALLLAAWIKSPPDDAPDLFWKILLRFLTELENSGINFGPSTCSLIAEIEYELETISES